MSTRIPPNLFLKRNDSVGPKLYSILDSQNRGHFTLDDVPDSIVKMNHREAMVLRKVLPVVVSGASNGKITEDHFLESLKAVEGPIINSFSTSSNETRRSPGDTATRSGSDRNVSENSRGLKSVNTSQNDSSYRNTGDSTFMIEERKQPTPVLHRRIDSDQQTENNRNRFEEQFDDGIIEDHAGDLRRVSFYGESQYTEDNYNDSRNTNCETPRDFSTRTHDENIYSASLKDGGSEESATITSEPTYSSHNRVYSSHRGFRKISREPTLPLRRLIKDNAPNSRVVTSSPETPSDNSRRYTDNQSVVYTDRNLRDIIEPERSSGSIVTNEHYGENNVSREYIHEYTGQGTRSSSEWTVEIREEGDSHSASRTELPDTFQRSFWRGTIVSDTENTLSSKSSKSVSSNLEGQKSRLPQYNTSTSSRTEKPQSEELEENRTTPSQTLEGIYDELSSEPHSNIRYGQNERNEGFIASFLAEKSNWLFRNKKLTEEDVYHSSDTEQRESDERRTEIQMGRQSSKISSTKTDDSEQKETSLDRKSSVIHKPGTPLRTREISEASTSRLSDRLARDISRESTLKKSEADTGFKTDSNLWSWSTIKKVFSSGNESKNSLPGVDEEDNLTSHNTVPVKRKSKTVSSESKQSSHSLNLHLSNVMRSPEEVHVQLAAEDEIVLESRDQVDKTKAHSPIRLYEKPCRRGEGFRTAKKKRDEEEAEIAKNCTFKPQITEYRLLKNRKPLYEVKQKQAPELRQEKPSTKEYRCFVPRCALPETSSVFRKKNIGEKLPLETPHVDVFGPSNGPDFFLSRGLPSLKL